MDTIDWSAVYDAYGPAEQAPDRINDLKGDEAQRNRAADWIYDAVLHQGTPFPAITPLLRIVPGLLRDPAFAPGHGILIRAVRIAADGYELMTGDHTLEELEQFAEDDDPELAPYVVDWRSFLQAMHGMSAHIAPFLGSAELRADASACLASLAAVPEASDPPEDRSRLAELAAHDALTRAQLVYDHGRLGGDTTDWLDDPGPQVRVAAAVMSPTERQTALDVLITALERPAELDSLFPSGLRGRVGFMRFTVIGEIIKRSASLDAAMTAFLAVVRERASSYTVDADWGRILTYVFASAEPGDQLTPHQRALLTEIVSNAGLWEPLVGNAFKHFDDAGLPFDREQLGDVLRANRMPHASP
jgi:hypothetical protein